MTQIVYENLEGEVLESFEANNNLDQNEIDRLKNSYDEKPVNRLQISFTEGTQVKACHHLENIDPVNVAEIRITLNE